jgi:hypothetical protein
MGTRFVSVTQWRFFLELSGASSGSYRSLTDLQTTELS